MLGGTAAWWLALRGGFPLAAVDRERNVALLKTKGGNLVAATTVSGSVATVAARPAPRGRPAAAGSACRSAWSAMGCVS
jgi:hypothetical protein